MRFRIASVLLLSASLYSLAAAQPALWPLFVAPQGKLCAQLDPAVASLPGGGFAVAWSTEDTALASGATLRMFDELSRPIGPEIAVSSGEAPGHVALQRASDGSLVVAWMLPSATEIWARRYDDSGAPLSPAVRLVSHAWRDFAFAAGADGRLALIWGSDAGLAGQWFANSLAPLGTAFSIDTATVPPGLVRDLAPSAWVDSANRLTVVWVRPHPATVGDLVLRRFDTNGIPLAAERAISPPGAGLIARVAGLPGDRFAVLWAETRGGQSALRLQRFDSAGEPVGAPLRIDEDGRFLAPSLASSAGGALAVGWETFLGEPRARFLAPDGTLAGASFALDTEHPGLEEPPVLGWLGEGSLLAVWDTSWTPAFEPLGCEHDLIFGRRVDTAFAADAPQPLGAEFALALDHDADGNAPRVAFDPSGLSATVWVENQCRQSGFSRHASVLGRFFDTDARPLGPTQVLASFDCNGATDLDADVASLPNGRFVAVWAPRGMVSSRVQARVLDPAAGVLGDEWTLGPLGADLPLVAGHRGGFFVLSRDVATQALRLGSFDGHGSELAPPETVATLGGLSLPRNFDLLSPPGGGAVVAWSGDGHSLRARRYATDLHPLSADVLVSENGDAQSWPRLAADRQAGFQVVWSAVVAPATSPSQVRLRRFGPDDTPRGSSLVVDTLADPVSSATLYATDVDTKDDGQTLVAVRRGSIAGSGGPATDLRVWPLRDGAIQGPPVSLPSAVPGGQPPGDASIAAASCGFLAAWTGKAAPQTPLARRFSGSCGEAPTALPASGDRFRVEVSWRAPDGSSGLGRARTLEDDSGAFWFFGPDNLELLVKVLDGRTVNRSFWVFYATLTNLELEIVVSDTETGERRIYDKPQGRLESRADIAAFPQPGAAAADVTAAVRSDTAPALEAAAVAPTTACLGGGDALCLLGNRFRVTLEFFDPSVRQWTSARSAPITSDTGAFWFTSASNLELLVKVIDGRAVNGKFWVFWGGLSNLRFRVVVADSVSGKQKVYRNPPGTLQSLADTGAF